MFGRPPLVPKEFILECLDGCLIFIMALLAHCTAIRGSCFFLATSLSLCRIVGSFFAILIRTRSELSSRTRSYEALVCHHPHLHSNFSCDVARDVDGRRGQTNSKPVSCALGLHESHFLFCFVVSKNSCWLHRRRH